MRVTSQYYAEGVFAGLVAGVVFGVIMWLMGFLPMVASLVGLTSVWAGFFVHLVISGIIGVFFALFFGRMTAWSAGAVVMVGIVYGFIWWVLGALVIMPLLLGHSLQLSFAGMQMALPSLWGHMIYGLTLGFVYFFTSRLRI